MKKIELKNFFHGTSAVIRVEPGQVLSRRRVKDIRRQLCPYTDCRCSDFIGRCGHQPATNLVIDERPDGSAQVFEI